MNTEKVVVPAHSAVIIRELVPAEQMHDYFNRSTTALLDMITAAGIPAPQSMRTYYFSGPGATFDMANGLVLTEEQLSALTLSDAASIVSFPATTAFQAEVRGAYTQLPSAWEHLAQAITEAGFNPGALSFEDYLNVPCDVPEEELRTLVVWEAS